MITKTTITRPNDTTAYATGDVINASGSTTPILLDLGKLTNNSFVFQTHLISSNASSTPSIDVYFFSASFTIAADNAALAPSAANLGTYLGKISHTSWTAFSNGKISSAKADAPIGLQAISQYSGGTTLATDSAYIYAVLVAAGAYTPTANEQITLKVDVD
jgi:hypothetical protein